ncbi:hypothetical protein D3C73_496480 [compost metagenome]
MNDSCPVLTPVERQYMEIDEKVRHAMMAKIYKAIEDATAQAAEELKSTEWTDAPPAYEYFVSVAHQKLFVHLCGGDPETFQGGDPELAAHILKNGQNIVDHYFIGAKAAPGADRSLA